MTRSKECASKEPSQSCHCTSNTAEKPLIKADAKPQRKSRTVNRIPDDIQNNPELDKAIQELPWNYNFEIKKTLWRIRQEKAKRVALQFPEGLLVYSCIISDIIQRFEAADTIILGDVTYGACCIDDLAAIALGADFMVHYGHSCLVPIDVSSIRVLYVFVDIAIDVNHLIECLKMTFTNDQKLAIMGTIQFGNAMQTISDQLCHYYTKLIIPQAKPLSPGEVLGCTSPKLQGDVDAMVFIADGRFHLESAMIANPNVAAYRYDPYAKILSTERYDVVMMKNIRHGAISKSQTARCFGIILGTLGRQGNPRILDRIIELLEERKKNYFIVLLSEIFPEKLALMKGADAWIQIACPRLSIDWGYAFNEPLLSPYEAEVCLGTANWHDTEYPMDFYAKNSGSWTNYHTSPLKK